MGGISIWQLLIIAVIVVLLFGTKKLGSIGSDLGASIKGFKKAMSDDEPKQDKTSQDADFTAKTIADKQADTNQEQAVRKEQCLRGFPEDFCSSFSLSIEFQNIVSLPAKRLFRSHRPFAQGDDREDFLVFRDFQKFPDEGGIPDAHDEGVYAGFSGFQQENGVLETCIIDSPAVSKLIVRRAVLPVS